MSPLARHVLQSGDHGRLRFHPNCPVCLRERLSGTLATGPLVPERTRVGATAALAAALLVTGNAGLSQAGGAWAKGDPGEVSDKELDDLAKGIDNVNPKDTRDPPEGQGTDDTVTDGIDEEPDGDEPAIPGADDPAGDARAGGPQPPAQVPQALPAPTQAAPPPEPTPPAPPVQPAPPAAQPAPAPAPTTDKPGRGPESPSGKRGDETRPGQRSPAPSQAPLVRRTPVPRESARQAPARPEPAARPAARPAAAPAVKCPAGDAETRVIRPGDSLWAIAAERLGGGASAAAIAREVARLWDLNADRIASGQPDLIVPGECLMLSG